MLELRNIGLLKTQAYINGQWVNGDVGREFDACNPAIGSVLAQVADLGAGGGAAGC